MQGSDEIRKAAVFLSSGISVGIQQQPQQTTRCIECHEELNHLLREDVAVFAAANLSKR